MLGCSSLVLRCFRILRFYFIYCKQQQPTATIIKQYKLVIQVKRGYTANYIDISKLNISLTIIPAIILIAYHLST